MGNGADGACFQRKSERLAIKMYFLPRVWPRLCPQPQDLLKCNHSIDHTA